MNDQFKAVGGTIGRVDCQNGIKRIGVMFKYNSIPTGSQDYSSSNKIESPVFILDPWAARYTGWHLLRRGIVDGVKEYLSKRRNRRKNYHAYHHKPN